MHRPEHTFPTSLSSRCGRARNVLRLHCALRDDSRANDFAGRSIAYANDFVAASGFHGFTCDVHLDSRVAGKDVHWCATRDEHRLDEPLRADRLTFAHGATASVARHLRDVRSCIRHRGDIAALEHQIFGGNHLARSQVRCRDNNLRENSAPNDELRAPRRCGVAFGGENHACDVPGIQRIDFDVLRASSRSALARARQQTQLDAGIDKAAAFRAIQQVRAGGSLHASLDGRGMHVRANTARGEQRRGKPEVIDTF